MRKTFSIIFLCSFFYSFGQITIESPCIPQAGDILTYSIVEEFTDTSAYLADGEDLLWTYGGFNFTGNVDIEFQDISGTPVADSFPSANAALNFAGFLSVAEIMEDEVSLIGLAGNPLSFITGDTSKISFSEPFTYKKTPISYGDSYEDDFEIVFTFPADVVPGADSIMLPIPGATLDSARVRILVYKSETASAWGTLNFNDKDHEVIKITQVDTVGTVLEAGVSFLGNIIWLDASAFVDVEEFGLGINQNTTTYKFLSANNKESIMEVRESMVQDSMGNNFIQRGARVSNNTLTSIKTVLEANTTVSIFPNPASSILNIQSEAELIGIEIMDIQGKLIKSIQANDIDQTIDISNLVNGSYFMRVATKEGFTKHKFIKQ